MEEERVEVPRVKLGTQGLEVSKLGFGCMGLTGVYNSPVSEADGISIIKYAFDKGITFFDTADVYGATTNEVLVGKLGIAIVPYSPLGRGFFGGKAVVEALPENSLLSSHPRFRGENLDKNKVIYARLDNLSKKHGCTPAQLALSWILHQGDNVVPIPGTTKIKNLDANICALKVKLTEEDLKEISDAVPVNEIVGDRTYESMSSTSWKFANTPPKDGKA